MTSAKGSIMSLVNAEALKFISKEEERGYYESYASTPSHEPMNNKFWLIEKIALITNWQKKKLQSQGLMNTCNNDWMKDTKKAFITRSQRNECVRKWKPKRSECLRKWNWRESFYVKRLWAENRGNTEVNTALKHRWYATWHFCVNAWVALQSQHC